MRDPAWSPNATRLAFTATRAGNTDIYTVARDGTAERRLTLDPASDSGATWSRAGGSIAFASTRDGDTEIYVMNADGTAPRRLTSTPGVDQHPAWSPDGRHIAFESERDGNAELYVMAADGSDQARLTFGPLPDRDPSWSPDGREIAFVSGAPPQIDLFAISPDSGRTQRLTTSPAADESPAWSPDGRQIVFSSDRGGASVLSLYVMNADGTPEAGLRGLGVRGRDADWAQLPPPARVPSFKSTANATPTRGKVLVRVPGASAFAALTAPREIPLGTRLDTRHGTVKLTTALPGHRGTGTTTASRGIFALSQTATTTDLTLDFPRCPSARASVVRRPPPPDVAAVKVKARSSRRYPVRVKGRYSIGASYGTEWTTTNRCSGTTTRVTEGTVAVRDLVAKRTVAVRSRKGCSIGSPCTSGGGGGAPAPTTPGEYVARAPGAP
jgi:TolB protein